MPNPVAYFVLAIFPLVVMVLYARLPLGRALIWSILLGYLFLPEPPAGFDFPAAPPITKHNIPALVAFLMVLWRGDLKGSLMPESWLSRAFVLIFIFSPILTIMTNFEPVRWGVVFLPGLGLKDMIALTIQQFLVLIPFMLARQHLASGGSVRDLLQAFMIGGLMYSVLMLIEIRLSPQLNAWIYGYYQHLFDQTMRFGGWRPIVFLYHGLWVAFFIMMAATSAWGLWKFNREGAATRTKLFFFAAYLTIILVMAKSLGAMIFMVMLLPIVVLLPAHLQIRVATIVGLLALSYPLLKGAGLVPEQWLMGQAAAIDPHRAGSLGFRFDNENVLLARAYEKPFFGWGSWGRNQIFDPISGMVTSVTDGRWIITIGVYGWLGFAAEFGLLIVPLVLIGREMRLSRQRVNPLAAPLSLLLAFNLADMLPNATLTPLTWLMAGALTGYAEALRKARQEAPLEDTQKIVTWRPVIGAPKETS
jgi:hypothetical protein